MAGIFTHDIIKESAYTTAFTAGVVTANIAIDQATWYHENIGKDINKMPDKFRKSLSAYRTCVEKYNDKNIINRTIKQNGLKTDYRQFIMYLKPAIRAKKKEDPNGVDKYINKLQKVLKDEIRKSSRNKDLSQYVKELNNALAKIS